MHKVLCVCAARPNFMKIAPIVAALDRGGDIETLLVHTGQHYDARMSQLFFDELGIPEPHINLGVGSGSHVAQTAEVMKRFESIAVQAQPDWVVVVGDVNSTLACALATRKLDLHLAHVEAGLRSFDRTMPEETNRVVTDALSDLLFVTEPSGVDNLLRENVDRAKIHFVGNVMIDTLLRCKNRAEASTIHRRLEVSENGYALLTLHRPSNVDGDESLASIFEALKVIARDMPVVFPIHPRTRKNIDQLGLGDTLARLDNVVTTDPLGYLDFVKLMANASLVLTDSGGIQEETTVLGVPCLTLRANTERPITIIEGTNRLTGSRTDAILTAYQDVRMNPPPPQASPALWDGHAAERIVDVLLEAMVEHTVACALAS